MEGVWDPLSIPLEQRGAAMGASGVCARGAEERVGGWGSLFLGGRDKKGGWMLLCLLNSGEAVRLTSH